MKSKTRELDQMVRLSYFRVAVLQIAGLIIKAFRRRGELFLGVALFTFSFAVYIKSLAPTITWRNEGVDGGDLVAAVHTLGIPHPPGYPTYVILGKMFTLLVPFGDTAYRLNLMSAFFAAATVLMVFLSALRVSRFLSPEKEENGELAHLLASSVPALALTFSPIFWSQATIAEVYALNAFFVASIIFALLNLRFHTHENGSGWKVNSALFWAFFLFGLGLGNHLTLFLLAPPALFLMLQGRLVRGIKPYILATLLFFLGLSVYLYLPLRASQQPAINWGRPDTWQGFLWMVSATPYRSFVFSLATPELPGRLIAWILYLIQQFNPLGLAIGVVGVWVCWERWRPFIVFTASYFLLVSVYAITYNTTDSYVYLIPAYIIFALWMAAGTVFLAKELLSPWLKNRQLMRARLSYSLWWILLILLLPFISFYRNYSAMNLSQDREAYEYARSVFETVETDALILADTDPHLFSLWYYRYVEETCSQRKVVAQRLIPYSWYRESLSREYPEVALPVGGASYEAQLLELVEGNLPRHTVYLTDPETLVFSRFGVEKEGLVFRVREK